MARTIRTKVYLFNELSEKAKQKVIEDNYDIDVNDFINSTHNKWAEYYIL